MSPPDGPAESAAAEARYWDSVARRAEGIPGGRLWREHCDAVHRALLERWLGGTDVGGAGVTPRLPPGASRESITPRLTPGAPRESTTPRLTPGAPCRRGLQRHPLASARGSLPPGASCEGIRPQFERVLKTDLFDEAVGEGLIPWLARRARNVVGIDISPAVCAMAQRRRNDRPGLEAVVADVRHLPFGDSIFDAILSNSTLDHFASLRDIQAGLGELARVLRPGGVLVLTMDNPHNPAVWLRNALPLRWLNRLGVVPYQVGATCGRRRLTAMLRQAGLQATETTAILHCPRAPAVRAAEWLARRSAAEGKRRLRAGEVDTWCGGPGERARSRLLRILGAFEALERTPVRHFTGYFLAVRSVKTP